MRIGLITGEYPPMQGGIGAYTDILSRHLQAQGQDIFIFSQADTQAQHDAIHLTNTVIRWGISSCFAIKSWSEQHQLDIVNLQFQTASFDMSPWIHFLPHLLSVPFVTTFHDLRFPYLFPKAGKLRDWIVMHLAKQSSSVIVTNHEDLASVQGLRAKMIPIGSNILSKITQDTSEIRSKHNLSKGDFILAYFGFINHSKGVDTLLHALKKLNNPNIKLLMIGGRTGASDPTNFAYAQTIDALITELDLAQQVIWTGYVTEDEVSAYLQLADIVTLPFRDGASFRRGSLMAGIEQNRPIITTKPSLDIPDFNANNMMLVPPDNPQDLAKAIQTLMQSPEKRQALQTNLEILRQKFDWNSIAQETLLLFEQVTGGKV